MIYIKLFEEFIHPAKDTILNLKNIPKERKEEALGLLKSYTKANRIRIK
jgi:hypothetical protein